MPPPYHCQLQLFARAMVQVWVCPHRVREAVVPGGLLPSEVQAQAAQAPPPPPPPATVADRRAVCRHAWLPDPFPAFLQPFPHKIAALVLQLPGPVRRRDRLNAVC